MNLFGFKITRSTPKPDAVSFAPDTSDDGLTIESRSNYGAFGGAHSTNSIMDLDASFANDEQLIFKYRELSLYSEIDSAIQEIVSEAVSDDESGDVILLNLSNIPEEVLPNSLHKSIQKCFDKMSATMRLKSNCSDYFRKWYTEGRIHFHAIIDANDIKKQVVEYRYIDPTKIKKINEVTKEIHPETGVELYTGTKEYYVYAESGSSSNQGIKIADDTIISSTSGLVDGNSKLILSYLHKAIRPANQLRMIEDANLIYFLARAPERRVFEVEVGDLPKTQVDSYIQNMIKQHRNKISYDSATGEQKESKRFFSILEDFWMPMRDGKGTKITSLAGGNQLTQQLETINYFRQKLYKSLNIPVTRLDSANQFNIGRATEISRDEVKFNKFISTLRRRFSEVFLEALRIECILGGVLSPEDWENIQEYINIEFTKDNHFSELKDLEILETRLDILSKAKEFQGQYFSKKKIATEILGQTEDEYIEEQKLIKQEAIDTPEENTQNQEGDEFGSDFAGGVRDSNTSNFDFTPSDEEENSLDQEDIGTNDDSINNDNLANNSQEFDLPDLSRNRENV
jgi:hypothetical protein